MTDNIELHVVVKDYDHVAPLAAGDVTVNSVDLRLDRDTEGALGRTLSNPDIDAGELSLSRHIMRVADGDRSFVGIPVFPVQRFRERCFFTTEESDLDDISDLDGKRIGTNEWPATGNTWNRAALRERGVSIDSIEWTIGPIDDPADELRPQGTLPDNVQMMTDESTLQDELLAGRLDALMIPFPPEKHSPSEGPIVRVAPDFKAAEQAFYRRTNVYPVGHLIGIRRDVFDDAPWTAEALFDAFSESKRRWHAGRRRLTDTVPWLVDEIEETTELIGEDWLPYGIESNRNALDMLCDEMYEQGLIANPIDPETVFEEWITRTE